MNAIATTQPFSTTAKVPSIDIRYGPYNSVDLAHDYLYDNMLIVEGLTVGIKDSGGHILSEYWYKGGTDKLHLVLKLSECTGGTGNTTIENPFNLKDYYLVLSIEEYKDIEEYKQDFFYFVYGETILPNNPNQNEDPQQNGDVTFKEVDGVGVTTGMQVQTDSNTGDSALIILTNTSVSEDTLIIK